MANAGRRPTREDAAAVVQHIGPAGTSGRWAHPDPAGVCRVTRHATRLAAISCEANSQAIAWKRERNRARQAAEAAPKPAGAGVVCGMCGRAWTGNGRRRRCPGCGAALGQRVAIAPAAVARDESPGRPQLLRGDQLPLPVVCEGPGCGQHVEQPATGRRRRFCSAACRQGAYRRRAVGVNESGPKLRPQGRRPLLAYT